MFSVIFGLAEIAGFSLLLSVVFTQFRLGDTRFLPCLGLVIFLLWTAQKITNMAQPTEDIEDGE